MNVVTTLVFSINVPTFSFAVPIITPDQDMSHNVAAGVSGEPRKKWKREECSGSSATSRNEL